MANPLSNRGISDRDYAAAVATAVGEAGREGVQGMAAVVDTLANRLEQGDFAANYGNSIADQAMAGNGKQYNAWMGGERGGRERTTRIFQAVLAGKIDQLSKAEQAQVEKAQEATLGVLGSGQLRGITQGATFYQNKAKTDEWGTSGPQDARAKLNGKIDIGHHTFTGMNGWGFDPDSNFDRDAAEMRNRQDWSYAQGGDTPGEMAMEAGAQRGGFGAPPPASVGMSFTPALPGHMDVVTPDTPGFNFSQFGGLGFNPTFAEPVTPENPPAATQPGWGSIAGAAISSGRQPTFATPPATANPDWGNGGPSIPAVATPDFTRDSDRTFQKTAPSTMSAPGPTGATLAGQAVGAARAPRAFAVDAPMDFSGAKMSSSAVTAALDAADREAEQNRALAAAYKPPSARDNLYGVAPAAEPPTASVAAPKAPQVQKVQPRIAPRPVFAQPPHPPSVPQTQRDLNAYGLGDSPGSQLSAAIGTPGDFMGSSTSPQAFAKGLAAVAAINGTKDAQTYASLLNSERPGIAGVAFDALQNQYAQATGQIGTPTLYDRFAAATGWGTPNQLPFNGIGASNSPSTSGMWMGGAGSQPTWANYSPNQQQANDNASGFWGGIQNALGFGAGAYNGWNGVYGSSGPGGGHAVGAGTGDLY